jgi:hypothetical protein
MLFFKKYQEPDPKNNDGVVASPQPLITRPRRGSTLVFVELKF